MPYWGILAMRSRQQLSLRRKHFARGATRLSMSSAGGSTFNSAFSSAGGSVFANASRRAVKPESIGVLNDCRDIVVTRIAAVLSKAFDTIEEELFELAEKSLDRDTQNLYMDARSQAAEKREMIEAAFKKQFISFFERKVSGEDATPKALLEGFSAMPLSLVGINELDEKLAIDDLAKRLTNKCDDELRPLSQRMGFLLSDPELTDNANPMSPDTIIKSLQAACEQMTSGSQTKLTVMRMMERHISKDMASVYQDVNAHLVSRKILPEIRPNYRAVQQSSGRKSPSTASDVAESEAQRLSDSAEGAPANDLFAALQKLMSANAGSAGSQGGTNAGDAGAQLAALIGGQGGGGSGGAVGGGGSGSGTPLMSAEGLLATLSQLQQQITSNAAQSAALANMRNFVPGESSPADLNMLHELKEQGVGARGSQVDAMTFDIVAMLFDYVFDDKAIPDTIKALIARLQIPVLKVAIIDKSFFSKKAHPARRLLDALAEASVCFAGQASKDDPLYQQMESVVDRVHVEFETDIQLFTDVLASFEAFLKERETNAEAMIQQSAEAVNEYEKSELARVIAGDEIERRASLAELPTSVAAMLRGPWARVLEHAHLQDGGCHERFQQAIECADDLIWSVTPKQNVEERRRLVTLLPSLLKRLQTGLDVANIDAAERTQFMSALVDCHTVALKAGFRVDGAPPAAKAAPVSTPFFEKLIAETKARMDMVRNASRTGVSRIQVTEKGVELKEVAPRVADAVVATSTAALSATGPESTMGPTTDSAKKAFRFKPDKVRVSSLKRGTWVEFLQASGDKLRAKLSWVSPLKGVFLFTSPGVNEALSIAPEELKRQLRHGEARVIEESSLIDRAVDRMVCSLSTPAKPG
jgi:Protein of unknown function (DUF1631)